MFTEPPVPGGASRWLAGRLARRDTAAELGGAPFRLPGGKLTPGVRRPAVEGTRAPAGGGPARESGGSPLAPRAPSACRTRRFFWKCGRVMSGVTARGCDFFPLPMRRPAPAAGVQVEVPGRPVPGGGGSPARASAGTSRPCGGRSLEKFPPYSVPTMKESRDSWEMMDPRLSRPSRPVFATEAPVRALRGFSPAARRPALVPRSFATASFCSADIRPFSSPPAHLLLLPCASPATLLQMHPPFRREPREGGGHAVLQARVCPLPSP